MFRLVVVVIISVLASPLGADDTEIYDDMLQCSVPDTEKYRFIFIVDNSGSMSSWEFAQSQSTINTTISEVLNSDLDDIEVAVVQYGTNHWSREHKYTVSVPFTDDVAIATNWNRHYGPGSDRFWDLQDHQPASLSRMRLDNVYDQGGLLDVTDATNVQFVFFTDAYRDIDSGCCSSLISDDRGKHGDLSLVLPGFGEYDALKSGSVLPNGLKAQFTILHVPPGGYWGQLASMAAAAIASPGGNYVGSVEFNSGDPEGPGTKPRRYVQGNFSVSDSSQIIELIQQVLEEVKDATYTNVAPAISVNAFNELQHRDELYFSVFKPSNRPRWGGNVKKYTINTDGAILDADGDPVIDAESGSVVEDAKSYWSDFKDGASVVSGGYRGKLTNNQIIYTDPTAFETIPESDELKSIDLDSRLRLDSLDLAEEDTSGQCVLIGDKVNGTVTVPTSEVMPESGIAVDPGSVTIKFTTSESVEAYLRLHPSDDSTDPISEVCRGIYAGQDDVHACTIDVDSDIEKIDLVFSGQDESSEVEYILEYNIPDVGSSTACITVEQQRLEFQAWLRGVDVYNENGNESFTDAHQFAADPLHSKPFVITYSGTSADDAKDILFFTDNLGMLHAVNPANNAGTKLWSYMPEEHLDNAKKLILNKAGQPKVYGLDGPISVVQRKADTSNRTDYQLREVTLYIGERRGGRNYYGVDVSNATSSINNRPTVKWKIRGGKSDQFDDLGQSWSRMLPRKIAYNCDQVSANCQFMEVLVFTGGYDPANDSIGSIPTGTLGNAVYIVDLETGGDRFFWSAGNNNDSRDQHRHDLNLNIRHSMVAAPTTIDTNGDGAIDMIYGITISGEIWRIDLDGALSTGAAGSDLVSKLSAMGGQIADLSGESGTQRFYNSLDISRSNPRTGLSHYVISAGSGFRAHPNDMTDNNNKLFVVYDPNIAPFSGSLEDKSKLYKYVNGERAIETDDLVDVSSPYVSRAYGYFLSASAPGEKFLQSSVTINNSLIISSFVPADNSDGQCGIGSGRTYFLDANSLESRFEKPFVELSLPGIPPETSILRLPKISICVGTNCASVEEPPEDENDENDDSGDCDAVIFTEENFGSNFSAAVSAALCGLETGRAYRDSWMER